MGKKSNHKSIDQKVVDELSDVFFDQKIVQKNKNPLYIFLLGSLLLNAIYGNTLANVLDRHFNKNNTNTNDKYASYLVDDYEGITLRVEDGDQNKMDLMKDLLEATENGNEFAEKVLSEAFDTDYEAEDYNRKEYGQYIVDSLKENKTSINVRDIDGIKSVTTVGGSYSSANNEINFDETIFVPKNQSSESFFSYFQEVLVHETVHAEQFSNGLNKVLNGLDKKDYIIASCLFEIDASFQGIEVFKDVEQSEEIYNGIFSEPSYRELVATFWMKERLPTYKDTFLRNAEAVSDYQDKLLRNTESVSDNPTKTLDDLANVLNQSPFFEYDYNAKFCDSEGLCSHDEQEIETEHKNLYDYIWENMPDEVVSAVENDSGGNNSSDNDLISLANLKKQKDR